MGHNPVPADGRDRATLMEVRLTRLEHNRLLDVLRDVLDEDF